MEIEHHTTYTVRENISLTDTEKEIFGLFTNFVQEKQLGTTIRVAGGWVRDKVLGKDSSDIDFAIDNMMGEEFVKLAHEFLKEKANVRGFGVTRFNPDKSKHLETATIEIKGIWIDVVNLRGETYSETSRVPQIVIGTPEQDAYRRDLTINALFYNIQTGKIEDFTGRGLEDLRNGIARTPLPPEQTFIDDPLRILRAVRFISRFDLAMDPVMGEALRKPSVLEGLLKKVSKERVGTELKLMLSHPNAISSINNFHKYNIFPYMVEIPGNCFELMQKPEQVITLFNESFKMCQTFENSIKVNGDFLFTKTLRNYFNPPDISVYLYLTMMMGPFGEYRVEVNPKSKKTEPLVLHLVKGSIKFTNNDGLIVSAATNTKNDFQKYASDFAIGENILVNVARTMKSLGQWGKTWELGFIVALVSELTQIPNNAKEIFENYEKLYTYIHQRGLNELFNLKPLLDGGQIQKIFEGAKGPTISLIMNNVFYWQVQNPDKTVEQLQEYIEAHKDDFLKNHFAE